MELFAMLFVNDFTNLIENEMNVLLTEFSKNITIKNFPTVVLIMRLMIAQSDEVMKLIAQIF